MKRIGYLLQYLAFVSITLPMALMPYRMAVAAGRWLGGISYHLFEKRRRIAIQNIQSAIDRGALPGVTDAERVAKETFRNLGRWLVEINKTLYGFGRGLMKRIRVQGRENIRGPYDAGRGVIIATGHCGNWELLGTAISEMLVPTNPVARKLDNPFLNWMIVRSRSRYGTKVIYKDGAIRKFLGILKEGGVVAVLMDQAVSPDQGVLVEFLGAPAWTTRMTSALAKRRTPAVVPVLMTMEKDGYVIDVRPEVPMSGDDTVDTQNIIRSIEDFVRAHPDQWLWIHRRWKNT